MKKEIKFILIQKSEGNKFGIYETLSYICRIINRKTKTEYNGNTF